MNVLLWIVTALYAGQSIVYLWSGSFPQAIMLSGYAFANVGLIWSIR